MITNWKYKEDIDCISTEALDFLMTEADDYLIDEDSVIINTQWIPRIII